MNARQLYIGPQLYGGQTDRVLTLTRIHDRNTAVTVASINETTVPVYAHLLLLFLLLLLLLLSFLAALVVARIID